MDATQDVERRLVSIVIPTRGGDTIAACLDSISRLDYEPFEVLICVDHSEAIAVALAAQYATHDERMRVINCDGENRGASATRNVGIGEARGEIIFFTDDDVVVPPEWLSRGLPYFSDPGVVGIEGKLVYVSDDHRQGLGDRVVENTTGGLYMTANAAYRRTALIANGLFDETMLHYQDRELAFRMSRSGQISYAADCVCHHQHVTYTVKTYLREAENVQYRIMVMKKTGDRAQIYGRVYSPDKLVATLIPPVILWRLRTHRVSSRPDWICFLLMYPRLWYERVLLWQWAARLRFFVL
jgi:cellulose synthase/poly-beta-1,6-N-acetylglucosamine synthase-like glycosyltransferase